MGTYRVFTKGMPSSIRITVEGEQVVSALCESYAAERARFQAVDVASLQLYLVALPSAGVPIRAAAEAAAIPSNLMEEGDALVEGAYYLAVQTPITATATGGEFPGFPLDPQHPTPCGWTQCVS
jgi:hypothetical protein